ncbi:MAG: beta-ketoacyl synthase chain length factor [Desulfovibrio sp.]|jgi:3-oxoacyl-[acyl-carrier-protein] synthase II|nr:beta-ketoacyl synthase chain length factor [Desulfovibrio sp.]
MSIRVDGYACLGSFGRDAPSLLASLRGNGPSGFTPATDLSGLAEFFPPRNLRQCDHFSRLALLGASLALRNAGLAPRDGDAGTVWGVVLASGYGPARPTFDFLDSILEHGEGMASPLAFSLSVHNIPAAILARNLGIIGPCATVCQYESAVASGLLLAGTWLAEGRADRVLFGGVDEHTPVLDAITARLAQERADNKARPCRRRLPLGEGAAFFVLSRADGKDKGSPAPRIEAVSLSASPGQPDGLAPDGLAPGGLAPGGLAPDGELLFASGIVPDGLKRAAKAIDGGRVYGNLPVAQALDCAVALAMLENAGGPEAATPPRRARCLNFARGVRGEVRIAGATS